MADITVIGSFVMDMVATMDHYPTPGESVIGKDIGFYPGGKGANQCVAIARLGGDVEMIGMLGKDANGDVFRNILKSEGIRCDNVFSCDTPTAVAQIQINAQGQNRICVIPAANYKFSFDNLDQIDDILKNTKLIVLQYELRLDVTEELIRRAHSYGTQILLNPAPAANLPAEVVSMVDYITPNETELASISGMPTVTDEEVIAAADKLVQSGVKCVVATLGERGALIKTADICKIVPGYTVKAVDTVAAGDSFNGAFAVALMEGKTVEEAVRFANAMGALTVQGKGAIPSLQKRAVLDEFIRKNS